MRTIAILGKGGIGKTTIAVNLSVFFAMKGAKVLHIGCDPKQDSCDKLVPGGDLRSVMDVLIEREDRSVPVTPKDIILQGRHGIDCIETGGPEPGVGCGGRGITLMFETLKGTDIFEGGYDVVIYDILGDIVCGGFAAPLRAGRAQEIYIVVSGETMSLYAANNICRAVQRFSRGGVRLAGLIPNRRDQKADDTVIRAFANKIQARVFPSIPRDPAVMDAEYASLTTIEYAESLPVADAMRKLFSQVEKSGLQRSTIPEPMSQEMFRAFISSMAAKRKQKR